jgi:hypothetical protein
MVVWFIGYPEFKSGLLIKDVISLFNGDKLI